jgi:hypothetical protein
MAELIEVQAQQQDHKSSTLRQNFEVKCATSLSSDEIRRWAEMPWKSMDVFQGRQQTWSGGGCKVSHDTHQVHVLLGKIRRWMDEEHKEEVIELGE